MMSTARLRTLHRQENNHRKLVCVMNDVTKNQQERIDKFVEKEKQEVAQKCEKNIVVTKRNLVRQRVLKKCMKDTCEEIERKQANKLFGKYQGIPMETMAGEIDVYLERHHPRIRRRQKIDELFRNGYEQGAILDSVSIQDRVRDYFKKPLVRLQCDNVGHDVSMDSNAADPHAQEMSATFPHLTRSFYTGPRRSTPKTTSIETIKELPEAEIIKQVDEQRLFVNRKVSKFFEEDISDKASVQSEAMKVAAISTTDRELRPITLPPLKLGTDRRDKSPVRGTKEKKNVDCIRELIERLQRAKVSREHEVREKKERRTKRLQADRVVRMATFCSEEEMKGRQQAQEIKDLEFYEEKKNELLSSVSNTKQKIKRESDSGRKRGVIEDGRLYLPPIKVVQRPVLLKY
ncbi:hypothetical protein DPMN_149696 [Dreissena polymorpha]|uniref:Uncharacterized protein n=1 Tax=Dreissena polymorpha TaxID=45954 RepID=A0A9D4J4Y0_DREPO|nr:hypothetical protein DPMN_149696 [Dreissena polymorpha]